MRFPDLNVLIANVGISRIEDLTSGDWDASEAEAIVQTNIMGVVRITAAFLTIKRADECDHYGDELCIGNLSVRRMRRSRRVPTETSSSIHG